MRICAFSPWPAPTIVFFTRLGAYSATVKPARAGTSMAMPRAWPSFRVAAALVLTKVCSTAASCGAELVDHLDQPVMDRHQPLAEVGPSLVASEPQAT